jgi:hypothetical protein
MTTDEYLAAIHLALLESPVVASYKVVRQRVTSQSGHLRVRIDLTNSDFLEAAEFFRLIQIVSKWPTIAISGWTPSAPFCASGGTAHHIIPTWKMRHTIATMAAKRPWFQANRWAFKMC